MILCALLTSAGIPEMNHLRCNLPRQDLMPEWHMLRSEGFRPFALVRIHVGCVKMLFGIVYFVSRP